MVLTQHSFDKLFRQYEQKLCAIAYSYVRDADTAKDVVQDSFARLWAHRQQVEFTNVDAYLFRIVRNRCLEYRRNARIGNEVYEKILIKERGMMDHYTRTIESCDPDELFRSEIMEICRAELERMPDLTRQIFTHRLNGKSYREISDLLHVNRKKVDNELQHAIGKLRLSLKDYLMASIVYLLFHDPF